MKRYGVKLYTTFDADLLSLNAAGISVPMLIEEALYARVRGEQKKYIIAGCPKYNLTGRKRSVKITVIVRDPLSISFLANEILPRRRSAFFKAIVREALVKQAVGVYFCNPEMREEEEKRVLRQAACAGEDIVVLYPQKKIRKAYMKLMADSAQETENDIIDKETDDILKEFGSVADLSLPYQQRRREQKEKENQEKKTKDAGSPVETNAKPEPSVSIREMLEENNEKSSFMEAFMNM